MDSNEPRFQGDRTSTLQIRCVEKSDEGHYKCLVKYFFEKSGKPSSEAKLRVCKLCSVNEWLMLLQLAS